MNRTLLSDLGSSSTAIFLTRTSFCEGWDVEVGIEGDFR